MTTSEWRPAVAKLCGTRSHPANAPATYSFGHGLGAAKPLGAAAAAADLQEALWWQPGHTPSTNEAANADVAEFWKQAKGRQGAAVRELTGKELARRVKQASRGAHVSLGSGEAQPPRSSIYRAAFCTKSPDDPAAADMYHQAKVDARANKALGTGSSVNLSCLW